MVSTLPPHQKEALFGPQIGKYGEYTRIIAIVIFAITFEFIICYCDLRKDFLLDKYRSKLNNIKNYCCKSLPTAAFDEIDAIFDANICKSGDIAAIN